MLQKMNRIQKIDITEVTEYNIINERLEKEDSQQYNEFTEFFAGFEAFYGHMNWYFETKTRTNQPLKLLGTPLAECSFITACGNPCIISGVNSFLCLLQLNSKLAKQAIKMKMNRRR
eukprot:243656_1